MQIENPRPNQWFFPSFFFTRLNTRSWLIGRMATALGLLHQRLAPIASFDSASNIFAHVGFSLLEAKLAQGEYAATRYLFFSTESSAQGGFSLP
jgi:hypothetical protein